MTSFGPLLTRNREPPPDSPTVVVPSGKYQLPRSVRVIPDGVSGSVPQQSTRSVYTLQCCTLSFITAGVPICWSRTTSNIQDIIKIHKAVTGNGLSSKSQRDPICMCERESYLPIIQHIKYQTLSCVLRESGHRISMVWCHCHSSTGASWCWTQPRTYLAVRRHVQSPATAAPKRRSVQVYHH